MSGIWLLGLFCGIRELLFGSGLPRPGVVVPPPVLPPPVLPPAAPPPVEPAPAPPAPAWAKASEEDTLRAIASPRKLRNRKTLLIKGVTSVFRLNYPTR